MALPTHLSARFLLCGGGVNYFLLFPPGFCNQMSKQMWKHLHMWKWKSWLHILPLPRGMEHGRLMSQCPDKLRLLDRHTWRLTGTGPRHARAQWARLGTCLCCAGGPQTSLTASRQRCWGSRHCGVVGTRECRWATALKPGGGTWTWLCRPVCRIREWSWLVVGLLAHKLCLKDCFYWFCIWG